MKVKLSFILILLLSVIGCTKQKFDVIGNLSGVESDSLLVKSYYVNGSNRTDTVVLNGGEFGFNLPDTSTVQLVIMAIPSKIPNADGSIKAASMKNLAFPKFPNINVIINGTIDDAEISGCEFYDDMMSFNKSVVEFGRDYQKIAQKKCEFIETNPQKLLSVYFLSQISVEDAAKCLDLIPEENRTGVLVNYYHAAKERNDKMIALNNAQKALQPGMPAPDFTLTKVDGEPFTLSSLKGKYVVLDFWGSWCGWCIKGFPEMKKYYEKYKNKVEFVGIACNDTEAKWKAAVSQNELPWINVVNSKNQDVSLLYAVNGFPTKYIIDKDGNLVTSVLGEKPEFYEFLDKQMTK
ncbi:MAG: redoxin domain-containing protein [Phocaeicola sp.]